jgi:hypothetical protein
VEARIGSPAKAGQIAGNFNTLSMPRVKEVVTAELLTSQLPDVHVVSTIVSSSVSDTNDPGEFTDFAGRIEDRIAPESVRMPDPTDLVQLPKGQAFALIHGGQLHKIRMLLPSAEHDPLMPEGLAATGRRCAAGWTDRGIGRTRIRKRSRVVVSKNASFHEGPLAGVLLSPLKLAFSLALGLGVLLLCVWIVDWVFVFKVWPQGIERLRELLAQDLAGGIALAARQGAGAGVIPAPANALYSIVFEATGIHDMGRQFANGSALSIPDTIMRRSYVSHREGIEADMVGTQLLGVRAAILARFAPLLLLLHAVGAADGFSQRAIRRTCGDASRPACTTGRSTCSWRCRGWAGLPW